MSAGPALAARRARRALRWYPPSWRARYGDEFAALLEDELGERPRAPGRTLDVARCGLAARAAAGGLAGPVDAADARRSLPWLVASLATFLAFGLAMWSQLVVGWQWTSPRTAATTDGTVVMSLCALVLAVLVAAAAVPVLAVVARRLLRGDWRLAVPVALASVSTVGLVIGARTFEDGWPGTGGHHWSGQGLVPGGVAAFVWSATLGVTSYWAHPAALRAFPAGEVAWMLTSPLAIVGIVTGVVGTLRRVALPDRVARYELRCAQGGIVAMAGFLLGALAWLTDDAPRPRAIPSNLFHVGAIDVVGAAVMVAALVLAGRATARGLTALRR